MPSSMSILRPSKARAIRASVSLTPKYIALLLQIKADGNKPLFNPEIAQTQKNLGKYVLMYDDERKIGRAMFLSLLGDDGYKEMIAKLESLSEADQLKWIEDISDPDDNEILDAFNQIDFPNTPEEWEIAKAKTLKLSEDERKRAEKQGAYLWCFIFSSFFNTLSLMVHGVRLTTLVSQAINGDDDAFLKAIQIDRMLLINYPYFTDRKFKAQDEGEKEFLSKIAYRESNGILRSAIRYPALYMLFGVLDTYRWLDDLKHTEILDICDQAGLDRYQNRIDDVNYLTKRLIEYRRWQKSGGLSMH